MRIRTLSSVALATVILSAGMSRAAQDFGSDGGSGAPTFAGTMTVDLGLAVTGDYTITANSPAGIYDPVRWAVVFEYTNVTVNTGAIVKFKNHPSGAPVVWLASGNVTFNGTGYIDLIGSFDNSGNLGPAGPGGFSGGRPGGTGGSATSGGGGGPGGGANAPAGTARAGSYATLGSGALAGATYGNAEILPLIGGSGGAGRNDGNGSLQSGGGGGGAILIACNNTVTLGTGNSIYADGGGSNWAGGSGGAIRILAETIGGAGLLHALGNSGGGFGRIRLEANSITAPAGASPAYSVVTPLTQAPVLFPPPTTPTIRVSNINFGTTNIAISATPYGAESVPADANLAVSTPVNIDLISLNVPVNATVTVRVVPRAGLEQAYSASSTGAGTWRATSILLPASGVAGIYAKAVLP